jgi:aspartyl-tRNA synthetase
VKLDLEMAFADGWGVMKTVEGLIKSIYTEFTQPAGPLKTPLPNSPFIRMNYEEAMARHGSDKPDLRIKGLVSISLLAS